METNHAAEHLQTIRTLMERSAIYRRALAPIMTFCGVAGIAGGLAGWLLQTVSQETFILLWGGVAVVALVGSFLLARRQALRDTEPFWSAPTRRVVQALWPPLLAGLLVGLAQMAIIPGDLSPYDLCSMTAIIWIFFYGCALHSAGFFMPRGIRLFGLGLIIGGCAILFAIYFDLFSWRFPNPYALMGIFFGGLHLAYGIYLYLTENKNSAA